MVLVSKAFYLQSQNILLKKKWYKYVGSFFCISLKSSAISNRCIFIIKKKTILYKTTLKTQIEHRL